MFGFNSRYLTYGGKPWFPVMGELHYSRCPRDGWRESLYKMKAGGVTVVSSYVIWIHHEEIEGEVDFSGNKDLREFLRACKDTGMYMFLRIGPWC
ncbi:MAG: beta-galactosidase, partial [Oscillospiraceae bacterium]|nr:beta-galactosidase [Oscillospiraceae bacterium]